MASYWVYMLASRRNGTLYTGSTGNLRRRIHEHRTGMISGFTCTYRVTGLVWYEEYPSILEARAREHTLKRWRRAWKIALIESFNPDWRDLYPTLA